MLAVRNESVNVLIEPSVDPACATVAGTKDAVAKRPTEIRSEKEASIADEKIVDPKILNARIDTCPTDAAIGGTKEAVAVGSGKVCRADDDNRLNIGRAFAGRVDMDPIFAAVA